MKIITDLEIHSKYARAVSKEMTPENLAQWAGFKGINVIGTGDFTHPLWFKELGEKLEEAEPGLFKLKSRYEIKNTNQKQVRFLLSGEISCIYSKNKKVRRIHHLVYAPSFKVIEKINARLNWIGNLKADGRPMLGLDSKELLKILIEASPQTTLIPAHVWTPWFGIFGSMSGFDSLQECFEELTPQIFAIETGLSSDPPMNWRIKWLDNVSIISSSDAHSLGKIGREASVFDTELSYQGIMKAIRDKDPKTFLYTIEFYPEEGKYHYSGHRDHEVVYSPKEERKHKGLCRTCQKPVTSGVMMRIEELADPERKEGHNPGNRVPYKSLVPLEEIIAETFGMGVASKKVKQAYKNLVKTLGSEFNVLLERRISDIAAVSSPEIAEGVKRVREGKLHIEPGYDGVFGKIKIFDETERKDLKSTKQPSLF